MNVNPTAVARRSYPTTPSDELRGADEVFITSSVRGLVPIASVDDVALPAPGPIAAELMARYDRFLAAEAARGPL